MHPYVLINRLLSVPQRIDAPHRGKGGVDLLRARDVAGLAGPPARAARPPTEDAVPISHVLGIADAGPCRETRGHAVASSSRRVSAISASVGKPASLPRC